MSNEKIVSNKKLVEAISALQNSIDEDTNIDLLRIVSAYTVGALSLGDFTDNQLSNDLMLIKRMANVVYALNNSNQK